MFNRLFKVSSLLLLLGSFSNSFADVWISPIAIESQIQQFVTEEQEEATKEKNAKWHVSCFNLPEQNIVLPGEDLQVVISGGSADTSINRKTIHVQLKTEVGQQDLNIPVKIQVEKPVWVVTELIEPKEVLTAAKLKKQYKTLDDLGLYTLSGDTSISNMVARVRLLPGKTVDSRQVQTQPVVYQNDTVRLVIEMQNGVKITTTAVALQNGAIGDRILIKREMPNKRVSRQKAVVLKQNTVSLSL